MGQGVHMQELPGIGKRYDIDLGSSTERISVVVRQGNIRDLYVFTTKGEDPTAVLELTREQALKLGAVLTGTFFEA